VLAIRLPEDIEKRLDRLAKRTGRTAEKRLEDLRAGRSHTVPLEVAMKRAGIRLNENDLED